MNLTIKTMDFDHVPNPGIDPPQFLGFFDNRFKRKINSELCCQRSLKLWANILKIVVIDHNNKCLQCIVIPN